MWDIFSTFTNRPTTWTHDRIRQLAKFAFYNYILNRIHKASLQTIKKIYNIQL